MTTTSNNGHEPLKIVGLQVNGFRKLRAIDMTFKDKGITEIKGQNKQGKTSAINSIEWLIAGNRVLNKDIKNPDAEKITGTLLLNRYEIKRVRGKSDQLQVKDLKTGEPAGGRVQDFLNTFINELTLNPRPFIDKTELDKLKFLMDLLKDKIRELSLQIAGMEFSEIDKALATYENERLLTGREVKKFGEIVLPEKVEKVDISVLTTERKKLEELNKALLDEYEEAKERELAEIEVFNKAQREKQKAIDVENDRLSDAQGDEEETLTRIEELKKELAKAEAELERARRNIEDAKQKLTALPQPEPEKSLTVTTPKPVLYSTDEIDKKIQHAGAINEKAAAYREILNKKKEKEEKEKEYNAFTGKIETLREKKFEILRKVDTGVPGLEIREDGVYYNGISSANWSDSESIIISSQLCLAQMPLLRAIFIDKFESFDADSRKQIEDWAKENDIQVIVTTVGTIPEQLEDGVFYIQEGQLVTGGKTLEEVEA